MKSESDSCSVGSNSLWPHGLYSPRNSQARILEWVAFPFSRGSSQPRNQTWVSCIAGRFFTSWATKEALWSYRASQFTVPSTFNFHHTCSYLYDVAEIFFSDWNEHRSDVETWVLIQPMPLITLCESWL